MRLTATRRRKVKPKQMKLKPKATAKSVGTTDHSAFQRRGRLKNMPSKLLIRNSVAPKNSMFARIVSCAKPTVGLSTMACTTWTPRKCSRSQTPLSFSSSENSTTLYSTPVRGSGEASPRLCAATPERILSSIASLVRGYFLFCHQAKRAASPEMRLAMTLMEVLTASGWYWIFPFSVGTWPMAFMTESGIAAAGIAMTFGKKDLNIVYTASFLVPVRYSS
mmetsp:Transcript_11877/g.26205  ORF Transcript_11877/g.26205 Transcript_11877/m.26205 type:complete len:221 (-) Transcript_11877:2702-3364(-)